MSVWCIPLLCVQWKTPHDGQRNCPKHVEFYSKNKFEKLLHLVGFITSRKQRLANEKSSRKFWYFPSSGTFPQNAVPFIHSYTGPSLAETLLSLLQQYLQTPTSNYGFHRDRLRRSILNTLQLLRNPTKRNFHWMCIPRKISRKYTTSPSQGPII